MDLRKLLSEDDKKTLENYVEWFANADYPNPKADTILAEWARVKEPLYHLLGDQFILEFPISYTKPVDDLEDDIYNFIYCSNSTFGEIIDVLNTYYENTTNRGTLSAILGHIPSLAENKIKLLNSKIKLVNKFTGKTFTISPNEKPFHAMGKLVRALDDAVLIEKFEKCRIKLSQITNQRSLSGTMSLSIHPMDYITMSDNDCGWDSCMNWCTDEGGDYRIGTVEMMNSPCVIVAYVKSATPFKFLYHSKDNEHSTWNSKKWRELFIVEDDSLITEIKAYPYDNEEFTRAVIDKLNELKGGIYDNEIYYTSSYNFNKGEDIPKEDWVRVNFQTNVNGMYNDFDCYRNTEGHLMRYNKKNLLNSEINYNHIYYYYSGVKTCMNCGSYIEDEDIETSSVICPSCGGATRVTCTCCGTHLGQNDIFWSGDDDPFCEECYYEHFRRDDITDEEIPVDEVIDVYLISDPTNAELCCHQRNSVGYFTTSEDSFNYNYNPDWLHKDDNGYYYILLDEVIDDDILTRQFNFIKDRGDYAARLWATQKYISYPQQIERFCTLGECDWSYARIAD